jgi:hypothetical protein
LAEVFGGDAEAMAAKVRLFCFFFFDWQITFKKKLEIFLKKARDELDFFIKM